MQISPQSKHEEVWQVRFRLKSAQSQGQEPAVEQSYLYRGILRLDTEQQIYYLSYTEKDELGKGEVILALGQSKLMPSKQEASFLRSGKSSLQLNLKPDQIVRKAKYHSEYGVMTIPYLAQKVEHHPGTGDIHLQYILFPKTADTQKMTIFIKYKKLAED